LNKNVTDRMPQNAYVRHASAPKKIEYTSKQCRPSDHRQDNLFFLN